MTNTMKLVCGVTLKINGHSIGYIQLVDYDGHGKPQLEFGLKKKHRNQGIMTQELIKFLDAIKDIYPQILAIVKKDNMASEKVLEKVGFSFFTAIGDIDTYLIDQRVTREFTEKTISLFTQKHNN